MSDSENRSYGSSSDNDGDVYFDGPSVADLDYNVMMIEAQQHVKTQYYGLPIGQEERNLMNRLTPDALKAYAQVREIINQATIYASEAIQKNWARTMSSSEVVNYFNSLTNQLEQTYNPMISTMQNQPADVVMSLEQLTKSRMKNVEQLFGTLHELVQLSNLSNSIDNLRLMQNMF